MNLSQREGVYFQMNGHEPGLTKGHENNPLIPLFQRGNSLPFRKGGKGDLKGYFSDAYF